MSANGSPDPCGILSDGEIARLSDPSLPEAERLIDVLDEDQLRPAGYDVAIGKDQLTTPQGQRFAKGTDYTDGVLMLEPGDTAELSSRESVTLPRNIAATLSVKTHLARQGLLLLTGNVIDPSYHGHLHFYVANVGSRTIELFPGESPIAALQFAYVWGAEHPKRKPVQAPTPARGLSLGFLAVLRDISNGYAELESDVKRNRSLTENVLMLGYFVLAATLLSMTLDHLLTIGGDGELIKRMDAAVPDSSDGKVLMGVFALSLAWIVHSISIVLPHRRRPRGDGTDEQTLYRREAILERKRRRAMAWLVRAAFAVPVISLVAWLMAALNWDGVGWLVPSVVALGATGIGFLTVSSTKPLRAVDITARATELSQETIDDADPGPATAGPTGPAAPARDSP